jgi:hypothetical protein
MGFPDDVSALAQQLRLDTSLLYKEIYWALGEERINKVTPAKKQFRDWKREADGLMQFWAWANERLGCELAQDDARDLWECIDLTLRTHQRRPFLFQDYLMIAVRSDQRCDTCGRHPPEIKLDIDRGAGSFQSEKVRTVMLFRRSERIPDLRRLPLLTWRIALRRRSIVAALIIRRRCRVSGSSLQCPCRSIELTITGSICLSRFAQVRSAASQTTISASYTA